VAVSAQNGTPTIPSNVDKTKPEAVKSYLTSVLNDAKSVETKLVPLLPSDKADQMKTFMEIGLKAIEGQLATATASAELADLATTVASFDAENKKAAANPSAYATSVLAQFDKSMKSLSSEIKSAINSIIKENAAVSDVSVSAARLTAGVIAGAAAFAVLF
ncbi:hypothetical protein GQ42DRAFT_169052, partial [Ramicandelaber brevisporus]